MWDKYINIGADGSGYTIESTLNHYINVYKYLPLKGGSYIEMPDKFKNSKKGLLNILNKDEKCFMWCHIAYLYPAASHENRVSNYKHNENKVNYDGINFPVTLEQIPNIENQNKINLLFFYLMKVRNILFHNIVQKINMKKHVICY